MGKDKKIAAIVLAAGFSSRAPGFKPLLPLGEGTVIEATVRNFQHGEIDDITVVTGHQAAELEPELDRIGVRHVFNRDFDKGMFSSIVAGVNALAPSTEAFFLLPGDMPLVRCHTIRTLWKTFRKVRAKVTYPVFRRKRGHPPLISAQCCSAIRSWVRPEGLRSLLALYETQAFELETADEGILLDIDTPEDYAVVAERFRHRDVPTRSECEAILAKLRAPESVLRHGRTVSEVAKTLAEHLSGAGLRLDTGLVVAAAMLHDCAKGKANHERTGARTLDSMGYCDVAAIVAVHRDIEFEEGRTLNEAAIVHLADKLVKGHQRVTIDERFRDLLRKSTQDGESLPDVRRRFQTARAIADAVERVLGMNLELALVENAAVALRPADAS